MQKVETIISSFKEKAEAVSAHVCILEDMKEALSYFSKQILEKGLINIAVPDLSEEELSILKDCLKDNNIQLIKESLKDKSDCLNAGLTKAKYGIAKTGTLLIHSDKEDIRIASMMPDIHFALLNAEDIVMETKEISEELKKMFSLKNNYTAFITGPSRTADIERVLALGAHGPVELYIMILKK